MPAGLKREWSLHETAFRGLLNWLDEGGDSGGERYLEIRRRLVSYFVRKNCLSADDLADETLTRVARRLEEEGGIADSPARYCYIVARFVFLEELRRVVPGPADDIAWRLSAPPERDDTSEKPLECLDGCLRKLTANDRELILEYYCGEGGAKIEHRRVLAARLGVTPNALSIRTCRIRDRLEECVKTCCRGG